MEEEYFSAERLLEVEMGSIVQVSNEEKDIHFMVNLVGVEKSKLVITSLPGTHNLPKSTNFEEIFIEEMVLEMRIVHDGHVIAFESSVKGMHFEHSKLLITSFPEMIQSRRLRRHTRFPCTLSCDVRLGDNESYGAITNISNGGCQLNLTQNVDCSFIKKAMDVQEPVDVEIFFPFADAAVALSAMVKSVASQEDRAAIVGLAFCEEYTIIDKYLDSLQLECISPFFQ